jgi:hypothetical protein
MTVFLRWGIFGIIGVAALLYAYNASKDLAHARQAKASAAPPVGTTEPVTAEPVTSAQPATDAASAPIAVAEADTVPGRCVVELDIARRALESRSVGEPLDRLLRIQEIAWLEDVKRRERLTQVATRWYSQTARVDAAQMRRDVIADCLNATP